MVRLRMRPSASRVVVVGLASLLACLAGTVPVAAAEADPASVMREIMQGYGSVESMRAEFRQEVAQVAFGQTYQANGLILYARGKVRWDYRAPDPQTYVVADNTVYWVQPAERQTIKMKLDQAFSTHHAVAALLGGMRDLDKYFTPIAAARDGAVVRLELQPKFENAQVVDVVIEYDRGQKVVRTVDIGDAFGNRNSIRLLDVDKSAKVPDRTFDVQSLPGYRLTEFGTTSQ